MSSCKTAFCSTFVLYLKTASYHWNVFGKDFAQFHELFGDMYSEIYGCLDVFAEYLRAGDLIVPGSMDRISSLSLVKTDTKVPPCRDMVRILAEDNETMIEALSAAFHDAESNDDQGFSNFLAERIAAHKKHLWMLKSTLEG